MKISNSNSKKQLAKIISENGGWCRNTPAICAVQARKHGTVMFAAEKPKRRGDSWFAGGFGFVGAMYVDVLLPNWHQTILSRDEYFFLYQNQGLEDALDEPVQVVEAKPTIEQLATDYRNAKDYAERKQQEADAAKADAEAKLAELVAAGKAFVLAVSVAPVKKYTGKFYNSELGESPAYSQKTRDAVCDGCWKRYGEHYGDRCKSGGEG